MRYTGGINMELAQAFLRETGTKAVLVTSLEYSPRDPAQDLPCCKIGFHGENAVVLWMKSIALSGDDRPGSSASA